MKNNERNRQMTCITISKQVRAGMKKYPNINWSSVAEKAFQQVIDAQGDHPLVMTMEQLDTRLKAVENYIANKVRLEA